MSLVQPPASEQRVSPSLQLATNNPFRARLSVVPTTPASPASSVDPFSLAPARRERPKSRNPFLDVFDDDNDFDFGPDQTRPANRSNSFDISSSAPKPQLTGSAAELFENLTITDHSRGDSLSRMNRPAPQYSGSRPRPPPPGHHKSRSGQEDGLLISLGFPVEASRPQLPPPNGARRPPPTGRPPPPNGDRSRDPRSDSRRRPRRNSDSSVIEAHETEARDRNRRERKAREGPRDSARDAKPRGESGSKSRGESGSKSRRDVSSDRRKKNSALDVIDKLDVTGIYGSGLFHHDGPFDACNPHRNQGSRRLPPVQAFPADSANNSMSGFGPLNAKADHSHIFGGRGAEAFNDYTSNSRLSGSRAASFDPKATVETVHGDMSLGLGTSTFLDGAPASRAAMQEALDERPRSASEGGGGGTGLQRKKSLVQKIRAIKPGDGSGRRRAPPPPGRHRSPSEGHSPTSPVGSSDGGGSGGGTFFNDYDEAYDKKGETISVVESDRRRERAPSSPKKPHLSRVGTDDTNSNGLLKRVRSLSKPKRRNE